MNDLLFEFIAFWGENRFYFCVCVGLTINYTEIRSILFFVPAYLLCHVAEISCFGIIEICGLISKFLGVKYYVHFKNDGIIFNS